MLCSSSVSVINGPMVQSVQRYKHLKGQNSDSLIQANRVALLRCFMSPSLLPCPFIALYLCTHLLYVQMLRRTT